MISGARMNTPRKNKPKTIATVSWILYDLANTAYSMNVVSLYFSTWVVLGLGQSDFWVSLVNSASMILVALTMPVLGDWSDRKSKKLPALFVFTFTCITGTFLIGLLGQTIQNASLLLPAILVLYVISNYSYQGGLVFYNALLPEVATERSMGRVSGYGVAFGYIGSIIGLIVARLFVEGDAFGLTIPGVEGNGRVAAFIPTAVVFALFAMPVFMFVKERTVGYIEFQSWKINDSYRRVWRSLKNTREHPGLLRFLIAKFLYEDSIQTVIIFMGLYTQAVMGFSNEKANQFFIMIIPAAVVGSAIFGMLSDHYGPKRTLFTVILMWCAGLLAVILTNDETLFWILGACIGVLLGATWTAARPLLITLVPRENLGEFFGLYALSGKVAAITGPLIWSGVAYLFANYGNIIKYKAAIAALLILMFSGAFILRGVPDLHVKFKNNETR